LCNFFCENVACLFLRRKFLKIMKTSVRLLAAQQAVEFNQSQVKAARKAVSMDAQSKVVKDIRKFIGGLIWAC
jgi:hypothetical protein